MFFFFYIPEFHPRQHVAFNRHASLVSALTWQFLRPFFYIPDSFAFWSECPLSGIPLIIFLIRLSSGIRGGLPWWLSSKESACNAGDTGNVGLIPRLGKSLGKGHGNPLQYSFLENPMDRGAWWAIVLGVANSWTWLKWLSSHACMLSGEEGSGDKIQFSSYHSIVSYTTNLMHHCWCWPWLPGWGNVSWVSPLSGSSFSPPHTVLFERKSPFKAHIHRVDSYHLKVEYCLSLSWMVYQQRQQTNKTNNTFTVLETDQETDKSEVKALADPVSSQGSCLAHWWPSSPCLHRAEEVITSQRTVSHYQLIES